MGAAVGTETGKKTVNVEINIVPFIDLMSCLTAFLLVTAVWVNIAQLNVQPKGKTPDGPKCDGDECDDPKLSVLVESDKIWIGVSRVNDFEQIPNTAAGAPDWVRLEERLRFQKKSAFFEHKTSIEVAADSTKAQPIAYSDLIAAMDTAVKAGFVDVGLTDAHGLSAYPHM
jgi:biopolymer transport protein ExbD